MSHLPSPIARLSRHLPEVPVVSPALRAAAAAIGRATAPCGRGAEPSRPGGDRRRRDVADGPVDRQHDVPVTRAERARAEAAAYLDRRRTTLREELAARR